MAVVLTSLTVQSLVTERWAGDLAGGRFSMCSLEDALFSLPLETLLNINRSPAAL